MQRCSSLKKGGHEAITDSNTGEEAASGNGAQFHPGLSGRGWHLGVNRYQLC